MKVPTPDPMPPLGTAERPDYTEPRGRHWAIWLKCGPTGRRRRFTTSVPMRRDARGVLKGGAEARAIHDAIAQLWEAKLPRWDLLAALGAGEIGLDELYLAIVEQGVRGADALWATVQAAKARTALDRDLLPLVEEWERSPLSRQDENGVISAATRRQMVARVLKCFSPALVQIRTTEALAARDGKEIPPRSSLTACPLSAFTADRVKAHLAETYEAVPTPKQLKDLSSRQLVVREDTRKALAGHGDGAVAAFNALRVFARWLVANGYMAADPTATLKRPRAGRPSVVHLTSVADIERLATRLVAPYDDMWRVLCGTGFEPSVALALRPEHIHVPTQEILGHGTKSLFRERRVESSADAWTALARTLQAAKATGRQTLWPLRDARGRKLSTQQLAREVAEARDALIAQGYSQYVGVTPYAGRHTFCVMALLGGATPLEVAQQLGHKDAVMVNKIYGLYVPKRGRVREALARSATHGAEVSPDD